MKIVVAVSIFVFLFVASTQPLIACNDMKEKVFVMKATFYKAYGKNARTKSGTKPRNGITLSVDPKVIPLGSWVEITYPDGKVERRLAEDTGRKIKGHHIDIFVNGTKKELIKLGVKKVKVRVL